MVLEFVQSAQVRKSGSVNCENKVTGTFLFYTPKKLAKRDSFQHKNIEQRLA